MFHKEETICVFFLLVLFYFASFIKKNSLFDEEHGMNMADIDLSWKCVMMVYCN